MYLKLSLVDELFIVKNLDMLGVELPLPANLSIKLYNKVDLLYQEILTISETTPVSRNLLTNPDVIYASVYSGDKLTKSHILINVVHKEQVKRYELTYSSHYGYRSTSNTFLKRYTLSMPAWSSAYKNDVSIYSKTIQPLFLLPERLLYKTNEYLWNNLTNTDAVLRKIELPAPVFVVQNTSTKGYIPQTLIKQTESINKVTEMTLNLKRIQLFENIDSTDIAMFPLQLGKVFNHLIIKSELETIVTIIGFNTYGEQVTETLYVNDVAPVTSLIKYKTVESVSSLTYDNVLKISNYINCTDTNTIRYPYEIAGTVTKTKQIDVPAYKFNPDTQCLNSYHKENIIISGDLEDSYRVKSMKDTSQFFVTNQEDLIVLTDGSLSTGLLRKTIETPMPIHPSNNNNSIVSVLTEDSYLDNVIEFQINTKDIVQSFGNVSILVKLVSEKGALYLSNENEWVEEFTYKFVNNVNPIYIEMDVSELKYLSLEVSFNSVVYQASVRKDDIVTVDTGLQYDKIFHTGLELIGLRDEKYFSIKFEKDYYELVGNNKISYSDYNPSTILVKTTKGAKNA